MPPDLRAPLSEYRHDSTRICVEAVRNIRRDHAKVHGCPAKTFCSLGRESFGSSGKSRGRRGVFGPAMCGNRGVIAHKTRAETRCNRAEICVKITWNSDSTSLVSVR